MAAYIVAESTVTDPQQFQTYRQLTQVALDKYGGRYIVRGGRCEPVEGDWHPQRVAIIEFASLEQARQFYESPEYAAARAARANAAKVNMLLVEGS